MDRIGYRFANEYENKFFYLQMDFWLCEPFGYYLHDKTQVIWFKN